MLDSSPIAAYRDDRRDKGRNAVAQHEIIADALQQRRTLLTEIEAKQILQELGIATAMGQLASSEAAAVQAAEAIGFPVALKISSTEIVHKSDVGGVQLNLQTPDAVRQAYRDIMQSVAERDPNASLEGVAVQPMAPPGTEVIIGMSKDVSFGPVLMFGLGGVMVEILKDVAFRIVPVSERDAEEMIRDIKGFPVLEGYRGAAPADLSALRHILRTISDFVEATPAVKEIDLNPVYAYPDGAVAVDARIILEDAQTSVA
jgi:acyl-CoA synthetase (NDP forming)